MSLPGLTFLDSIKTMPLMELPVRSVVLALPDARLLWAPGSNLTDAQLRDAGAVTDIVAPSLLHSGGMARAAAVHPTARLWGVAGVEQKHPELKWHGVLGRDPWPYPDDVGLVPLAGIPKLEEVLLLHHASRTLLVVDLAFNIENTRGFGPWLILHVFGTYARFAMSRLFLMGADKAALSASLQKLAALEFENVVPSHGAPVLKDGKRRLLAAVRERGL